MSNIYQAPEAPLNEPIPQGQYGSLERALAGNYELKPIEIFKNAWANLSGMKGTFWTAAIIYGLIAVFFELFFKYVISSEGAILPQIIWQALQTLVLGPLGAGIMMIAIKHSVGVKAETGELFKYYSKIWPLFVAYVLMVILILVGLILLIIPGIYLMIAYSMAMVLIVEKDMGPWEALETSRKAISKKWFNMAGMALVSAVVLILGIIALLVGLIWAIPLMVLAYAIAYRNIFGVEAKTLNT